MENFELVSGCSGTLNQTGLLDKCSVWYLSDMYFTMRCTLVSDTQPFAASHGCFDVHALLIFTSPENLTLQFPAVLSLSREAEECLVEKKRKLSSLTVLL